MAKALGFLIRYFSNYYTLHRSDLTARAAPLDPRLDCLSVFFFQAEDGIRDCLLSRGLGDVYKRQDLDIKIDVWQKF